MSEKRELWLPQNVVKCTVVDGQVRVWDEMTFEKKPVKQPPGFGQKPAAPPDDHRTP